MSYLSKQDRDTQTVRRDDILDTIAKNITDREILNDIIESVESQIAAKASRLIPVVIPQIGSIVPNENKIDALSNNEYLNEMKRIKSPKEFEAFNREFITKRFLIRGKYKSRESLIRYGIKTNKKRATRLLREGMSEPTLMLYFYFFSQFLQTTNDYE